MKNKIIITLLLLFVFNLGYCYENKVTIIANPSDAKIYINDEYKGVGNYELTLTKAINFTIRIEKPGYKTEIRKYKYKASKNSGFISYGRDAVSVIVSLEEDKSLVNTNKTSFITKLETIKNENLISADDYLELKDKLLNNSDGDHLNAIDELTNLRKILNTSFITKEDYAVFKRKIISKNYDYSEGNRASDKLNILKTKSESGDYSKAEIDKLKIILIKLYK